MNGPPAPTRRLFIGLYPDAPVQAAIDAQRALWHWPPRCRLTRPQRIHLTLHFLGEVDAAREAALREALADVPMRGLDLVLATPQIWRRNRIAVLLADRDEGLTQLHERLARQVRRAGLAASDTADWIPHLTIGRETTGAHPPADVQPIPWRVSEFVLVWSRMAPVWRHEVLASYPARLSSR